MDTRRAECRSPSVCWRSGSAPRRTSSAAPTRSDGAAGPADNRQIESLMSKPTDKKKKRKGRNLTWICVYLLLAAFCLDRWILSFSCLISLCRFPKSRSKVANLCKEYKESKRRDSDHCADGGTHLLSGSGCERCHLLLCDGERQPLSGQGAIRTGQGPTALPAPVDASDGRHFDRIAFCKGKYQ